MKMTTEQGEFAQGTALVARGLMNRPPHPVLAGVKLAAVADGGLTITGFDYERSTVLSVPANVTTPGEAVVPGRLLADIAKTLPAKPVELSLDADRVTIVCGSARYTLNTLPLDEYPALPVTPAESGTISGPLLAAAVAQVAPAAARDDTLPALTSIRIEADDTQLTLSATDRYRVAVRRVPWKCPAVPDTPLVCLPADHLLSLTKAAGGTETIRLHFPTANSLLGITAEPMAVTMRQLEEKSPDWRPLWPKPDAIVSRIRVERTALIEAARRVSLVLGKTDPIRLDCAASRIKLAAGSQDDAQAHDRVDAILDGEPMRVAFNPNFLGDALDAIDTPEVEIRLQGPTKPGLFLPVNGDDDPDLQVLVMPIRLSK